MVIHRSAGLTAVVAAAALALTACGGSGGSAPSAGADAGQGASSANLSLGSYVDLTSWDPSQAHVGHFLPMYQAAYDSLIRRTPDGELEPMLATKWKYNDDSTELTMDLRTDVVFSDGEKFGPEAVKANLESFVKGNGPQASTMAQLDEVKVVDDDTVKIELKEQDPAFLIYLSNAAGLMGSPKAIGGDAIKTAPVGSGPYVMDKAKSVAGSSYVFTANPDYWNKDLQKFGTVTFKVLLDVTSRLNALVSGQVDATLLDPKTAAPATGAGMVELDQQVDWQGLFIFDRAGTHVKALGDPKVRQAINYAIDRPALLKALLLDKGATTSQIAGTTSAANDKSLDSYYDFDPEKAKSLLAEAGYADGFSVKMPTSSAFDQAIFSSIAQQLGAVGIKVQQVSVPATEYRNEVMGGKFPIAFYSIFQGEPWIAANHHISKDSAFNPLKYSDKTSEGLISRIQKGGDDGDAAAKELNRYVTEQAWYAPFFRVDQIYFHNKKVDVENEVQQAVPSIYNYSPAS